MPEPSAGSLPPVTLPRHRLPVPGLGFLEGARHARRQAQAALFMRSYNADRPADATTLWFYPLRPHPLSRITKIAPLLGLRIGQGIRPGEPSIAWDTATWFPAQVRARLSPDTINVRCADVSKSRVDRIWTSVAGYSIAVDPLRTDGPLVVKSEVNSRRDGRIVRGPLRRRAGGYVYQRFIDSREGDSTVVLRSTVVAGQIAVVVRSWSPATRWYLDTTRMLEQRAPDVYSATEIAQLCAFTNAMGLDYAELDVLRDSTSGLIYVVDANPTPYGPSAGMTPAEAASVTRRMADAFADLLASRRR